MHLSIHSSVHMILSILQCLSNWRFLLALVMRDSLPESSLSISSCSFWKSKNKNKRKRKKWRVVANWKFSCTLWDRTNRCQGGSHFFSTVKQMLVGSKHWYWSCDTDYLTHSSARHLRTEGTACTYLSIMSQYGERLTMLTADRNGRVLFQQLGCWDCKCALCQESRSHHCFRRSKAWFSKNWLSYLTCQLHQLYCKGLKVLRKSETIMLFLGGMMIQLLTHCPSWHNCSHTGSAFYHENSLACRTMKTEHTNGSEPLERNDICFGNHNKKGEI